MTRNRALVGGGLALAAVLLAGLPASGSAQAGGELAKDLDALVKDPALRGASVGLVVRKADTGELLYASQGDQRRQPASNMKLISSAAAMEVLGPDYRFKTEVLTEGNELYLKGTGDPTVLPADYDELARSIAATGFTSGALTADDTWFDATRLGRGWAWDDEPFYYNAEISALTVSPDTDYDAGSHIIKVLPGAPGKAAGAVAEPPTNYLTIDNRAITSPPGSAQTITVERQHGTNTIRVTGFIPAGSQPVLKWTTVREPTGLAASLFRDALARHGVTITGPTKTGAAPTTAQQLAKHESMPLKQLLVPFMKLSNNMHAEILVKAAGRAVSGTGSWNAGIAAMGQRLKAMGVDPASFFFADGSGLSRMNQVTPEQLITLLRAVRGKPWFTTWYDSLPIAGVTERMAGGTLRSRMQGTPAAGNVHAKTGTLTGVSALSGYVTSADGQPLVFAMVSNNYLGSAKAIEDAVAVRLAQYRADETARIAPQMRTTGSPGPVLDVECSWVKAC